MNDRDTPQEIQAILNADEVSAWLRIPKSTLYKLCGENGIPAVKIGRHWRFDRQTIGKWLQQQMESPREKG